MNENTQLMVIPKPLFDKPLKLDANFHIKLDDNFHNWARDVYGPILDLLYYLSKLDPDIKDLIRSKYEEVLKGE